MYQSYDSGGQAIAVVMGNGTRAFRRECEIQYNSNLCLSRSWNCHAAGPAFGSGTALDANYYIGCQKASGWPRQFFKNWEVWRCTKYTKGTRHVLK
jgi:hypothetical protein